MNPKNNSVKPAAWSRTLFILAGYMTGCSAIFAIDTECKRDKDCLEHGSNLTCIENFCIESDDKSTTSSNTETDTEPDSESNTEPDSETEVLTGMDLLGGPCTRIDGMTDPTMPVPDNAVLIGSILPISGELQVAGKYFDHVTQLALEEINRAGGIMGRDLIKVSCDSGTKPETAKEAAEHLRDLGIQAILGPFSSEIVMSVYSDILREAGMMLVSAGANAPIISKVSEEGLIWSTSMPAAREATAIAANVLNSQWKKVAVIHRGDTWGDSMFNAFYEAYCSDNTVDCTDDDYFMVRSYDIEDQITSISETVTDLSAFAPDITVAFSYIDDSLTLLNVIEKSDAPLERFLWNNSLASELVLSLLEPQYHSILCQIQMTTQQMPNGLVYGSFLTRYRARWDGEDPVPYTASFYDAAYLLAYAYAAAASDKTPNPSGEAIAAAMTRLSDGVEIKAGAEDWNVGIMALQSSGDSGINYVGASGEINFPEGTGSMICPVEATRFNIGNQKLESVGLIYSAKDQYTAPDYTDIVDSACGDRIAP